MDIIGLHAGEICEHILHNKSKKGRKSAVPRSSLAENKTLAARASWSADLANVGIFACMNMQRSHPHKENKCIKVESPKITRNKSKLSNMSIKCSVGILRPYIFIVYIKLSITQCMVLGGPNSPPGIYTQIDDLQKTIIHTTKQLKERTLHGNVLLNIEKVIQE